MKKYSRCILYSGIIIAFLFTLGCKNQISGGSSDFVESEPEKAAMQYIRNMRVWDNIGKGRNATAELEYPDYFNNMDFVDEKGNKIIFNELPDDKKTVFCEAWHDYEVKRITGLLENDSELLKKVVLENQAVQESLRVAERNLFVDCSSQLFIAQYLKKRSALVEKQRKEESAGRSSSGEGAGIEITSDCLVEDSVNALKSVYKKGLVLLCTDTSSSISSMYIGHCAMTYRNKWDDAWNKDGLESVTISSWPLDKKTSKWKYKVDGVQVEPLGYWAGNSGGSARHVKVLQMQIPEWEVHWAWIFPYFVMVNHDASAEHAGKAVAFAESKKGCPYAAGFALGITDFVIPLGSKWWIQSYYCSHIVWRSWVHADIRYDFSGPAPLVSPGMFELAGNKRIIKEYTNY